MPYAYSENGLVILSEDGLPRRGGAMNTRQAFEHLASLVHCESHILRLHEKLLAHNIWLWRKGMVESHLGIESKSVAHWSGFVDRIKRDGCRGSIPDFEEIERLIAWIQG